ncbi:MAG TPA: hydantoinase B/oxoprolinase family protein [Dehalococcoidia bacterium]|nr:hydantoinase B/oxoprolinase family protein [Dehalococcoidia bacterium]
MSTPLTTTRTATHRGADPLTVGVVWNALIAYCEEMGLTLRRTAFSEAVREGQDFSTGLFDAQGRMIAQGDFSPGHLGSMPYMIQHVTEVYPADTLKPGDAILTNDLYIGSGHLPDFFLVTPAFDDAEKLIGYAVNCAHQIDVGGYVPGSQAVEGVHEHFQEGIRILPTKAWKAGEYNEDLARFISANVRIPEKVLGDIQAMRNANRIGEVRLRELFARYGEETMEASIERIFDQSEAAIRAAIARIPDGRYEFTDYLDDVGRGTDPVTVHVAVTVAGDSVTVDFAGSSPQTESGINSPINYTRAYGIFAIRTLTDPLVPQNEGGLRPITITAPLGSFFNPKPPCSAGARAIVQVRIYEVINAALAPVLPQQALGSLSHWANPCIGGENPATGRRFIVYDIGMAGYGATHDRDGVEGLAPVFNTRNIPVEVDETRSPIVVERVELIPDSGGPGKYRGGLGLRKDIRLLADQAVLSNLAERQKFPGYGVFGGRPGAPGSTVLVRDGEEIRLGSKEIRKVFRNDLISQRLNGAGGYGNPLERDPAAVLRDVVGGYVTIEGARRDYGVIIDPALPRVDEAATRAERESRSADNSPN